MLVAELLNILRGSFASGAERQEVRVPNETSSVNCYIEFIAVSRCRQPSFDECSQSLLVLSRASVVTQWRRLLPVCTGLYNLIDRCNVTNERRANILWVHSAKCSIVQRSRYSTSFFIVDICSPGTLYVPSWTSFLTALPCPWRISWQQHVMPMTIQGLYQRRKFDCERAFVDLILPLIVL